MTNSGKTAAKPIRRIKALSEKPKSYTEKKKKKKKNQEDALAEDDYMYIALF